MRNLLITGGAGFIGSNFVRYWRRRFPGDRPVVLDALTYAASPDTARQLAGDAGLQFVHGDIRDGELVARLLAEHDIDTIVNFAAESHVDRSIDGPAAFVDSNVVGTHTLLQAARLAWSGNPRAGDGRERRFHQVSTDEVYGSLGPGDAPFTEDSPYRPNSPYAASKAAADHLVRAYHKTYGLNVTISNCSNNFGPYQFPEKLIPLMLVNSLRGRPLPVYGDGQNVRDWLYVDEHCRGIELVLERGRPGETYNVGATCEQRNIDLVRMLCAEVDAAFRRRPELAGAFPEAPAARGEATDRLITFVADRPGHDRRYALDTRRIREELGYGASVDFRASLVDTINWYLAHRSWWEPLMSRVAGVDYAKAATGRSAGPA